MKKKFSVEKNIVDSVIIPRSILRHLSAGHVTSTATVSRIKMVSDCEGAESYQAT